MKYLKSFNEGFFDLFKRRFSAVESEDEKILNEFIIRLRRVKGESPYIIKLDTSGTEEGESQHDRYIVEFDDVPLETRRAVANSKYLRGWNEETQERWLKQGAIKKNGSVFYSVSLSPMGEKTYMNITWQKAEEIFNLVDSVYKGDKEWRRIEKIRMEMNPAADRLDPNINKLKNEKN
jgi:hypothetical protein